MKLKKLFLILFVLFLASCHQTEEKEKMVSVSADELIDDIGQYNGKVVETEGLAVHICGVKKKKLKLKTDKKQIIKVVYKDSCKSFDKKLAYKFVKVMGQAKESRISKACIDSMEKEGRLLCHIDHTPCMDSAWVEGKIKSGIADSMAMNDIAKLRKVMLETGKDYVSLVTIYADTVSVLPKKQ